MIETRIEQYNNHQIAVAHHYANSKNIVIFCHGYRGSTVGPARFFVRTAQKLEKASISSFRFDQFGSGNSEGDFYDSSFNDWVATTKSIAQSYLSEGYKVCLFGQSMGAATVIAAGTEISGLSSVIAWVPDPNVEDFTYPEIGFMEECGQRVQALYWQQAYDAKIANKLADLDVPALIIQCTDDEYVDATNRKAISDNARPIHRVINYENYKHGNWTYDQSEEIISRSVDFIIQSFN
jgi:esterase/lipase